MADERITIAGLDPISVSGMDAVVPVMRGGDTFKMTLEQVRALFFAQADNIAPALKDLSNTVGPRGKYPDGTDPSGDLNLRREQGYWIVGAGAPNNPLGDWGVLRVETDGAGTDATQYVRRYLADSPGDSLIYKRGFNTGTGWTAWIRVRENEVELDARYIQLSKLGMEYITGAVLGSGYTQVDNDLPAQFKSYQMVLRKLKPAADGSYISGQFKRGGSWITVGSSYIWTVAYWGAGTPQTVWNDASGGAFNTAMGMSGGAGIAADTSCSMVIDIFPGGAANRAGIQTTWQSGNNGSRGHASATAVGLAEAFRFKFTTTDIGGVEYELYGRR